MLKIKFNSGHIFPLGNYDHIANCFFNDEDTLVYYEKQKKLTAVINLEGDLYNIKVSKDAYKVETEKAPILYVNFKQH